MSALYVYGITPSRHTAELAELAAVGGLPPGAVRTVGEPDLPVCAVVSPAPADLRGKRRDLQAHQQVLDALTEHGGVLPMRFGVLSPDQPTLLANLRAEANRYRDLLAELAGQVELNLKAVPDEEQFVASAANDRAVRDALTAARRDGSRERQMQLGQTVNDAVARRRELAGTRLLNELRPLASRSTVIGTGDQQLLNAAFLLPRTAVNGFVETVDRLREQLAPAIELVLTGPLPPYSFVGN
jgi:hypothetical protein